MAVLVPARSSRPCHPAAETPLTSAAVDDDVRTRGVVTLAVMSFFAGRHEDARALIGRWSLASDVRTTALAKSVIGWLAQAEGDWDRAAEAFEEALGHFRAIGDRWGEALSLLNLGEVARSRGDRASARDYYERDLEIYRELGELSAIAATLCNLAFLDLAEGADATARLREALQISLAIGNRQFVPGILVGFAASSANDDTAGRLIGAADACLERLGSAYEPADRIERDRIAHRVPQTAIEAGRSMTIEEALGLICRAR